MRGVVGRKEESVSPRRSESGHETHRWSDWIRLSTALAADYDLCCTFAKCLWFGLLAARTPDPVLAGGEWS